MNYSGNNIAAKIYLFYLRNLSNHPFSRKLRRFISSRIFQNKIEIKSEEDETKFSISTFDFIDQEIIFKKSYEPKSIFLAKEILKTGGVFVDVGANFGLYTCHVAQNEKIRVIAIEPNTAMFKKLEANVKLNNYANCELINLAIDEIEGELGMFSPAMNNSGNYQITKENAEFFVSAKPLSKIFEERDLNHVDLIKIDVEGYELQVLKSIDWNLLKPKHILLEYIPSQQINQGNLSREVLSYLIGKGYSPYTIENEKFTVDTKFVTEHNLIFNLNE
jgi:FkbM family methyltransferase